MPENKTKVTELSVPAFIAAISDPAKQADAKELVKIMQRATGEKPKMWGPSIIGFGTHHYVYESGREGDMPLAAFSPRKAATVLYGLAGSKDLSKLGKYTAGKGCLYVKKLSDVDQTILESLVKAAFTRKR
jgi:hypothetical protein